MRTPSKSDESNGDTVHTAWHYMSCEVYREKLKADTPFEIVYAIKRIYNKDKSKTEKQLSLGNKL